MLGPLEREVVSVLEGFGQATTRQVHSALRDRGKIVAYTTVSTILTRLHAKGCVDRRSEAFKGGARYVYEYKDIQGQYIDELLEGLIVAFGPEGIDHLSRRIGQLCPEEIAQIRRRIPLRP